MRSIGTLINNPPAPGSPEWGATISASKIPAILGVSRYQSPYRLWHEMAGHLERDPMDPMRAAWGHCAEESLAKMWLFHNPGWTLNPLRTLADKTRTYELAYTREDLPFPNLATIDRRAYMRGKHPKDPTRFHIIECKTARSLEDWGRPGEDDAIPADYLAQTIWQMGISGIHQADIMVLAYGSGPELHPVEWDEQLFDAMVTAATDWHTSLKKGTPPDLDDTVLCYDAVRGLHPEIDKGTEVQVDMELATAYLDAVFAADEAGDELTLQKSRLIKVMGTAHKAMVGDTKIADRRLKGKAPVLYANKKANLVKES